MNPVLKNILAVIGGVVIGGIVNMAIVMVSDIIIEPPAGADVSTIEGLRASMHLFDPKHFIMSFLAHAIGTFTGAIIATLIAAKYQMRLALAIGCWFLVGGIAAVVMLPATPVWFMILDLGGAYLPMAYLGATFTLNMKKK
jgi:hypothetical protein